MFLLVVIPLAVVFAAGEPEKAKAGPSGGAAQPPVAQTKFTVVGHAVHENTAMKGKGGNILEQWLLSKNVKIEWLTFGVSPIHDRIFREVSLASSEMDAAFFLNRFTNETMVNLFEPLDQYQQRDPIPGLDGISKGMRDSFTFDGKLYGIPYRHATTGLFYNETMLKERGLSGPPKTIEQLIEYAEKLTYTRADGTLVHGFVMGGVDPSNVVEIAWALGGDYITDKWEVKSSEPGMVRTIELLTKWYAAGVIPKAQLTLSTEDVTTYLQQGRAAMSIGPFGRYVPYNDPKSSKFPGQILVVPTPGLAAAGGVAPARTEVWAMVIPKNSAKKELAWSFIKELSTQDACVRAAINGNGPTRVAAYDDPRVQAMVPYWKAEAEAVARARVPLPGFKNSAKVEDIFREEVQAALVRTKAPQAAMDDLTRRTKRELPR